MFDRLETTEDASGKILRIRAKKTFLLIASKLWGLTILGVFLAFFIAGGCVMLYGHEDAFTIGCGVVFLMCAFALVGFIRLLVIVPLKWEIFGIEEVTVTSQFVVLQRRVLTEVSQRRELPIDRVREVLVDSQYVYPPMYGSDWFVPKTWLAIDATLELVRFGIDLHRNQAIEAALILNRWIRE